MGCDAGPDQAGAARADRRAAGSPRQEGLRVRPLRRRRGDRRRWLGAASSRKRHRRSSAASRIRPAADNPSPCGPSRTGRASAVAELQGLDKVTARTRRFYRAGRRDRRASARSTSRSATAWSTRRTRRPNRRPISRSSTTSRASPEQKLFAGWMFASTPALSALDDGVYDVRVLGLHEDAGILAAQARAETRRGRSTASASSTRNSSRGHLDRAEAAQMLGHELAVEQPEAALDQPRRPDGPAPPSRHRARG